MAQLLVIEPDPEVAEAITSRLTKEGHVVRCSATQADGLKQFKRDRADAVIVCSRLTDGDSLAVVQQLLLEDSTTAVLVTSAENSVDDAVEAIKLGAAEYLKRPLDLDDLVLKLVRSLSSRRLATHLDYLKARQAEGSSLTGLVGSCSQMRLIFEAVVRLGRKTTSRAGPTVLLSGETGTGKGVLARALHYNSMRRDKPFVEVNCASIPENLTESEMFGAERGAFTGAHASRIGLVETAEGGTLFLDEIASLSLAMQAKLLTVLDSRRYRRVGSAVERDADIQTVVATNIDLHAAVDRGEFREDLMHRLEVIVLRIPPLRERGEDRMLLAENLRDEICKEYGLPKIKFGENVRKLVEDYSWPGNVRELRNSLEQILLLEDEPIILARHFHLRGKGRPIRLERAEHGVDIDLPEDGVDLAAVEAALIDKAMDRCEGNITQAARLLGISRDKLRYKLGKKPEATGA